MMKVKGYLKRILALVLSVAMVVPNVPMRANATEQSLEVKRNDSLSFEQIYQSIKNSTNLPKADLKVFVDVAGTTKTVTIEDAVDAKYVVTNGEETIGDSSKEENPTFDATGTYGLKSYNSATVTGTWKGSSEYDALVNTVEAAEEKANEAAANVTAKEAALGVANAAVSVAQSAYESAKNKVDNADAEIEKEKETLVQLQNTLTDAQEALDAGEQKVEELKEALNSANQLQQAWIKLAIVAAENALLALESAVTSAQAAVTEQQTKLEDTEAIKEGYAEELKKATETLETAKASQETVQQELDAAKAAKTEADNAVTAAENQQASYISNLELEAKDISYDAAKVTYVEETVAIDEFKVKVYDELKVVVVDENKTMESLPEVEVSGAPKTAEGVYKLYDNETASLTVPNVARYRFAVEGAKGSETNYTAGPLKTDSTVTVTYTEIGASSVNFTSPTGATILVNGGEITSGTNVSAGTELTVTVTPKTGYTVKNVTVKDKDNQDVELTDNKFTTSVVKENVYTISAEVAFTGSKITAVELGDSLTLEKLSVDAADYTVGDVIAEGGKTVVVETTAKPGYAAKEMTVIPETGDSFVVTGTDGKFSFEVRSGMTYAISFEEGVADVTSSLKLAEVCNAKVLVKVEGDNQEYTLNDAKVSKILPGAEVTVTINPNENNFVKSFGFTPENIAVLADEEVPGLDSIVYNQGKVSFSFKAGTGKEHKLYIATESPVLETNAENTVELNKYTIKKMQNGDTKAQSDVEDVLWTAFTSKVSNSIKQDIEYQYAVGEIVIPAIKITLLNINISETSYPIWNNINEEVPSTSDVKKSIESKTNIDFDNAIVSNVLKEIGFDIDAVIAAALRSVHTFGAQETETVKAVFAGNNYIPAAEATAKVQIIDGRIETVTTAKDFAFTYGSALTGAQLAELAQITVTTTEGSKIEWNANDITFSKKDLGTKDAGTYTVKVEYAGNDDYQDSTSAEITVTINKAKAAVTMTGDNVVKYKNREKLLKDGFLYKITPNVAIEDSVAHIPFSMGLDAVDGKLAAKVDLSKMIEGVDPDIVAGLVGNELSMSLSDFMTYAKDLILTLEKMGIDTGLTEDTFKVIYAALEEASGSLDVEVTITLDGKSYIPQNHGVYLAGVVTTDPNYNTAYGVTYIVITAEPVVVYFLDEAGNINHDRQFVFDNEQHGMTAKAYELNLESGEAGDAIEGGIYTYYYVGVQSDGTSYASTEAPVQAGSYTVTATFRKGDDAEAPELFGMTTGGMVIWPADVAEVTVTDNVVTYNESNPTPVDVMDMITVAPEGVDGDKAKLAVITAGLNVAGDFSEDGLSALEGIVNVDFPARADEILKKIVPGAYGEGISLATLNSKLGEIKTKFEEYGVEAAVIDEIMATIDSIPDVTTLTFKEMSEVAPTNIGAYFVAAVVFDPNYVPDADAGVLLITPAVTEEILEWTYNDPNGIITLPIINDEIVDLSAVATVKPEVNNAKIKYCFAGIDEDGNMVETDDASTLGNGVYTQIAYIPAEADADMMIAKPIVRTIVIAPQNVHVDFVPDENVDNARVFTYTGSQIEMPVEVKYLDGTAAKEDCLTVTYTGVDVLGNVFENTTEAPVNTGVYTVVASYREYDEVTGELLYFGMNVGTMAIEPAASSVDVKYTEAAYDGNPHMADIENERNLDMVKIIVNEEGNVNIILPEEWNVDGTTVKVKDFEDAIDEIIEKLGEAENLSEEETKKVNALIKEIEKALSNMDDAATEELKAVVKELKDAAKVGAGAIYAVDLEIKAILKEIGTPEAEELLEKIEKLEEVVKSTANKEEISDVMDEIKNALKELKGSVSEETHAVLDKIEELTNEIGVTEVSKLIAEIKAELENIQTELGESGIKSITINGEEPIAVGTYKVTAIVAGRNYKVSADTDTLVIYPAPIEVTINVTKKVENKGKEKLSPEGFEFVLTDAEGKVIDKQNSDAEGKTQFILTFDKEDLEKVFSYVVKETNTGKANVTYSTEEYDITFSIDLDEKTGNFLEANTEDGLTCEFVNVYDYTKPSESGGSGSGSGSGSESDSDDSGKELEGVYHPTDAGTASTGTGTSTGDGANVLGYAALIVAAGAVLVFLLIKKRKA